jgi:hypothetical protein
MKNIIRIPFLFLLFAGIFKNYAQIPNNTWRDHLPYSNIRRLAEVNHKIYCATSGGMFSFNKEDNSLEKYSKVDGLADVNISTIGYSENEHTFIVCYENGNIDLIAGDSITNLPDIKRKLIAGDKKINDIFFMNEYAYLACGFGIVVIDLKKKEIKDSYLFGPLGNQIYVNDITFDGENIVASTKQGIYRASLNSPNLVDYTYWEKILNLPEVDADYKSIVYFAGKLLTIYQNPATSRSDILEIHTDNWTIWSPEQENYRILDLQHNNLIVISDNSSQIFDNSFNLVQKIWTYLHQYALYDEDNILWIADRENGLIKSVNGSAENGIYPNGPKYPDVGELVYQDGYLWVGSGNEGNVYQYKGAYLFKDEQWSNFNIETIPDLIHYPNISDIAVDPSNPNHIFGGHTGYGVIEIDGNSVTIYDETNSVLKPIEGYGHGYIFITGLSFDRNNDLWISANYEEDPVYVRRHDGTWENIKLKYDGFGFNTRVNEIFATSYGQIWLLLERSGILVFHENQDGSFSEKFFAVINQQGDLMDRVYSVNEDIDGNIWVGTIAGPVVYYSPYDIIDREDDIIGTQILIPRNDGTNLADPLLKGEKINCIVIDGANRKWLGTEKSGAFLMSEDGKQEIFKFNSENSPLFSDNVRSIAINDDNGEVFFGTDKGILSFKGQATKGGEEYQDVYVYPNPVRENYRGDITVTGLVANVNVKITDISGNLVYETQALGGQAIWDGKNFNGERVSTGVYLVFCSNDDGTKTYVTKLLFIH